MVNCTWYAYATLLWFYQFVKSSNEPCRHNVFDLCKLGVVDDGIRFSRSYPKVSLQNFLSCAHVVNAGMWSSGHTISMRQNCITYTDHHYVADSSGIWHFVKLLSEAARDLLSLSSLLTKERRLDCLPQSQPIAQRVVRLNRHKLQINPWLSMQDIDCTALMRRKGGDCPTPTWWLLLTQQQEHPIQSLPGSMGTWRIQWCQSHLLDLSCIWNTCYLASPPSREAPW